MTLWKIGYGTSSDVAIEPGPNGANSSVYADAASGLSKLPKRERRKDEKGGTAPKSKET
jgi:hypothetical protein